MGTNVYFVSYTTIPLECVKRCLWLAVSWYPN